MNSLSRRIEELTNNSFPAVQTELFDGWILRYSGGYTYRANCICPIYTSHQSINEKIDVCEKKYCKKNLPTIFKLTSSTDYRIEMNLEQRGYQLVKTVNLMVCDLHQLKYENFAFDGIESSHTLDDEWLNSFIRLKKINDANIEKIQSGILSNISLDTIFVKARRNNEVVGCGLGILDHGLIGLYDLCVNENYRRQGIGIDICHFILKTGIENNAVKAYLQVHSSNEKAINLYKKIGFYSLYKYWFREKREAHCINIID